MQLGRPFEVKGAWLEIVPKRRSQVACGFAHSTRDHREVTPSIKCPCLGPLGGAVTREEGAGEKFSVDWGYTSEEGVSKAACVLAESEPSAPDPVMVFVAALLSAINDKAVV
jgi:hypothetical protein